MDFIEFIGWIVFGYIMIQLLSAWITVRHIKHAVRDIVAEREEKAAIAEHSKIVQFERVVQGPYDVILAFSEDNKFILQGSTQSEVEQLLKEKYPEKTILFVNNKEQSDNSLQVDTKVI